MVVYGHLTPHNSPAELALEFNVQPSMRAEANVTIGRYDLGEPIPVSENFATDTLAKEALSSRVTGRAQALFWLLLGLRDDLLGDSEQALETFRQAEEELGPWKEEPGGGSEILYFFSSGPWILYGGASPFTGYGVGDRPGGATQMCILVANADHSVQLGTGNCVDLPQ